MNFSMLKTSTFVLLLATFFFSSCEKEEVIPTPGEVLVPTVQADQKVETAVLVADYQNLFDLRAREGYRPVWIDGFLHRAGNSTDAYNTTMFNVVFEKTPDNLEWAAYHGLTSTSYQAKFDEMTDKGFRLAFIESYPYNGGVRYAPIFVKEAGPVYKAVHGLAHANWQNYFDDRVAEGYRLVNRSVVFVGGSKFVTALFDKKNVGSWISKSNMSPNATQTAMEDNQDAGRMLIHLDIAQENTIEFTFGAVWTSEAHNNWYALNKLDQDELEAEITVAKSNGYKVTLVSAYDEPGLINGNEVHFIRYAVGFRK
ncbi:MAG: hypothetical protein AAFZ63_27420 [Bacteroidota bacterium]